MAVISMRQAAEGLVAFLAGEVAKIPDIKKRFLAFGALGAAKINPGAVIAQYEPALKMVGIMDDDGNVDLDAVKAALVSAFANVPTFDAFGFTFSEADAETLLRHLQRAANN